MKWLRVAWGFVKTFWWVILLVLAVVATGVVLILNRRKQRVLADAVADEAPSLVRAAQEKVQDAVTDVRVERATDTEFVAETRIRRDSKLLVALAPEDAAGLSEDAWTGGIRYGIETDCLGDDCMLVVDHGNGTQSTMQLVSLQQGRIDLGDGSALRVEEATRTEPEEGGLAEIGTPRIETVVRVQRAIDDLYAAVLPWLSLLLPDMAPNHSLPDSFS